MAYAEEEAVDGEVVATLLLGAYMLHEVRAFDKFCSVEAYGVGVEEHVDIFFLLDATLHHLGCAQERFAHDEIYLRGEVAEIESFLTCGVASAHYCNLALAVEEAVACGACRDAESVVFLFVLKAEIFGRRAGGDDYGLGLDGETSVGGGYEGTLGEVDVGHDARTDVGTET